jgi:uncharacterized protein (DUF362 family)
MKMTKSKQTIVKIILFLMVFTSWLYWDLNQATASRKDNPYRTYKLLSSFKVKTSVATKVAIVRSDDDQLPDPISVEDAGITYEQIEAMVRRAIALTGGFDGIIKSGDMVLLKPNIVDPEPPGSGEVTDVRVIKALIKIIDEIDPGKMEIVVGEGSPRPMHYEMAYQSKFSSPQWNELWDAAGYQDLLTDLYLNGINLRFSNLNGSPEDNPWQDLVQVEIPGGGQASPQESKYFIHKDVLDADVYITVPVMKIHTPGITVALKNQIGLAPSTKYGFSKTAGVPQDSYSTKLIHGTWTDKEITDLSNLAQIDFVIVDAIACLEREKTARRSNGIITNLVRMNCIVAGIDPVAVDHVCTRLMGMNPDDIEHVTLAEIIGVGTNDPEKIEIVGADLKLTMKRFIKSPAPEGDYGQSNRIWLLHGPYFTDGVNNPIDEAFITNEDDLAPVAGKDGWSEPTYFIEDHINLGDYFNYPENVVSYTFTYFDAPQDQTAELWIGSDEAMKIWLNGEVVYSYTGVRTFNSYYTNRIIVQIKSGENRLLVKTLQKYGNYNFTLNICEPENDPNFDGNRVLGLKFKSLSNSQTSLSEENLPQTMSFTLYDNYPNPFNSTTIICYDIDKTTHVKLSIYDVNGRLVKNLYDEQQNAGHYKLSWDGHNENGFQVSSGVYFYNLQKENQQLTKKLIFLK